MFTLRQIHDNAFGGIGDRYNRYFDPDHFLGRNAMDDALWSSAKTNVRQSDDHYHIEIAVPGFSNDEIEVSLSGDRLMINCTKPDPQDKVPAQIHREYSYNQVSRTFLLPKDVDADRISSKYRQGILYIDLPLRPETGKVTPKHIEVG